MTEQLPRNCLQTCAPLQSAGEDAWSRQDPGPGGGGQRSTVMDLKGWIRTQYIIVVALPKGEQTIATLLLPLPELTDGHCWPPVGARIDRYTAVVGARRPDNT